MARQSVAVRKRRQRAKRKVTAARESTAATAEDIEPAVEAVAPVVDDFVAAAEPVPAVEEPTLTSAAVPEHHVSYRPLTLVRIPDTAAEEADVGVRAMPAPIPVKTPMEAKARLDRITLQWCDLAERRLDYYTELYRSGRWRRYYTEERFVVVMNEVAKTVANWRALADRITPQAGGNDDLRLSA